MENLIQDIRRELDALPDARGLSRAVLIVDIANKTEQLFTEAATLQRRVEDLTKALNEQGGVA